MTSVELTIEMPDDLVQEAEAAGLLSPDAILWLIRQEIRQRRVERLFAVTDRLAGPALSEAEVETEIQAARSERRGLRAAGG
jgi:hypothetical protein